MRHTLNLLMVIFLCSCNSEEITPLASGSDYLASVRQIKTGLVDYGRHAVNPDYTNFIAGNYDYMVTGEQNLDFNLYKSVNPDMQIYAYWNSILLSPAEVQPPAESSYLHNGPANESNPAARIGRLFEADFYYVMNTGNVNWQTHSVNQISQIVNNGFDGIHLDDIYAHLMHEAHFNADEPFLIGQPDNYTSFITLPNWYNAQQDHDNYKSYIAYISANVSGKVIYNGINDLAENLQPISSSLHPNDYLGVADGSVQEGFVYNGLWVANPEDGFLGDEYWEAIVQVLMDTPSDKVNGVVAYGDVNFYRARLFAYASFLMGYNPDKEVTYYYTPDEFTLTYLPEWNLKLGSPVDNFTSVYDYQDNGIFKREFANGMVIINPYGVATGDLDLGAEYDNLTITADINVLNLGGRSKVAIGENNQLRFARVTSVNLPPYSAVILMKN